MPFAINGRWRSSLTDLEWTNRVETVYNFGVDEFHTYFVAAIGAWVHNCYERLKPKLGNMGKEEFERLTARWDAATSGSLEESLLYHAGKHGGDDLAKFLRQAENFNKRGATSVRRYDGRILYKKGDGQFLIERDGKIVSYGKNTNE
ncbi:MAG: hypothetical protein R3E66_01125 [bacterium]